MVCHHFPEKKWSFGGCTPCQTHPKNKFAPKNAEQISCAPAFQGPGFVIHCARGYIDIINHISFLCCFGSSTSNAFGLVWIDLEDYHKHKLKPSIEAQKLKRLWRAKWPGGWAVGCLTLPDHEEVEGQSAHLRHSAVGSEMCFLILWINAYLFGRKTRKQAPTLRTSFRRFRHPTIMKHKL